MIHVFLGVPYGLSINTHTSQFFSCPRISGRPSRNDKQSLEKIWTCQVSWQQSPALHHRSSVGRQTEWHELVLRFKHINDTTKYHIKSAECTIYITQTHAYQIVYGSSIQTASSSKFRVVNWGNIELDELVRQKYKRKVMNVHLLGMIRCRFSNK